jgi:uncharacterized protein YcbK (DUF882 family)
MIQLKHFTLGEFACPKTGRMEMDEGFLAQLDRAREIAGIPFRITSGFRSPEHNAAVGGHPNSRHLDGEAADIAAPDSESRGRILQALVQAGLQSFAVSKERGFIHVDTYWKPWLGIY